MQKPKITRSKIEQVIDLNEMTGLDLTRSLKESMGQALIDRIIERTESGIGVDGRKMRSPYSKSYQNTIEFKAAGKSATAINLKLTGDMLASVDLDALPNGVRIYVSDDQVDKAHGHLTGREGLSPKMKRNWFGVTQKDVAAVIDDFGPDLDRLRSSDPNESDDANDRPATIRAIDIFKDDANDDD